MDKKRFQLAFRSARGLKKRDGKRPMAEAIKETLMHEDILAMSQPLQGASGSSSSGAGVKRPADQNTNSVDKRLKKLEEENKRLKAQAKRRSSKATTRRRQKEKVEAR